jgi:uncharacterized metal-binding protein YceD (DUF177 family)
MESNPNTEFSRIVIFDDIGITGANYNIEAKEPECRLLATRFRLISVNNLKATFDVVPCNEFGEDGGSYRVTGEVVGDVVQTCVSTLQDVPAHVQVEVNMLLRRSKGSDQGEEFMIDLEDDRDIEYYTTEFIDLGETAAQYLFLNLDPFPHAPDAPEFPEDHTPEPMNPLAKALEELKKK